MSRLKTALSLYVAIAAHALLILLVALGAASSPQLPQGGGLGLGAGGDTVVQAGEAAEFRSAPAAVSSDAPGRLALAARPIDIGAPSSSPRSPAAKAPAEVPPVPSVPAADTGSGASVGGGRGGYLVEIRRRLDRNRRALPGVLGAASSEVAFVIDARGAVSALRLARASGFEALDAEALAVVRRAAPFPPPPDGRPRALRVPISVDAP